jgi:hypothetical protein
MSDDWPMLPPPAPVPAAISLPLISRLLPEDLKSLAAARNVSEAVPKAALRLRRPKG